MNLSRSMWRIAGLAFGSLLGVLVAPNVLADVGIVTLTGPTTISIAEDGLLHGPYIYTLTNNSGVEIEVLTIHSFSAAYLSGDPGDAFGGPPGSGFTASYASNLCTNGLTLQDNESCDTLLRITVPDGTGETDADFGVSRITMAMNFYSDFGAGVGVTEFASAIVDVTVTDPVSVPEPATLALLSLGLAGLGFSRRRTLN